MNYILVIDDDRWYSQSVANMLDSREVVTVETPEAAIEEIDKNIPYMIYLDLELGTRNGLTVLNELQSWTDTRQIPIILLSSDGKRLDITDWQNYGVVAILDKSALTPQDLKESLKYGKSAD
jgi:CheY-like chemotaxis protein